MHNDFQKAMIENKDVAWQIVKVFHPDILDEYPHLYKKNTKINTKDRLMKINTKYDWVTITILAKHQLTICFVDEFDKLFISGNSNDSCAHESTTGVQNEFLKVLEGRTTQEFSLLPMNVSNDLLFKPIILLDDDVLTDLVATS